MNNIKMTTRVRRVDLLVKLRNNMANHQSIVQEARDGYIKKARIVLEQRLEQLRKGHVVALTFTLSPPADYTEVYKNSIEMLEWNTNEFVELAADEFRQLVRDEWDWTNTFLHSNSRYSEQAFDWLNKTVGGSLVAPPE